MTTVEKLRKDLFLVQWENVLIKSHGAPSTSVSFEGHTSSYSITLYYFEGDRFELDVTKNDTKRIKLEHPLPETKLRKLTAYKQGIEPQVLPPSCDQSTWGSATWPCPKPSSGYCSSPSYESRLTIKTSFQLIFEFGSWTEGGSSVLSDLTNLLDSQNMVDIKFQVDEEEIGAHLLIVTSRSPLLAALFAETKKVIIEDIIPEVFKQFLRFLYTGTAPDIEKDGMADALLVVADKYGVETLKDACVQVLSSKLSVGNAVRTLIVANLHTAEELEEATLNFMAKNGPAICRSTEWETLLTTHPALNIKAVRRMLPEGVEDKKEIKV